MPFESAERLVLEGREAGEFLDALDGVPQLFVAEAVGAPEEIEIFVDRDVVAVRKVVGHVADHAVGEIGIVEDGRSVDEDVPRVRNVEGGENAHRRRLAGTVGSDKADYFAG